MTALPLSSGETPARYPNKNRNNRKTASSLSPSRIPTVPRALSFPLLWSPSLPTPTTQERGAGQLYK